MPLIHSSTYQAPALLFNGHLETIFPSSFRKVEGVTYVRDRLELPDGDFLDLDWLASGNTKLVIIAHGLEGSSHRHYSKGMARYFHHQQWDALAWNCRSCSGEMNRLPRFYHHGDTADLEAVIQYAQKRNYSKIALVGFSMGGSMVLKYLGERGTNLSATILGAATFSVPCNLGSSAAELDKPSKSFYRNRFLKKLGKKIASKALLFPTQVSVDGFEKIKTFREFDNRYTAPLHHFKDADDFYQKASAENYLRNIELPSLLVNAANDPFLPKECYPVDICRKHPHLSFEIPKKGGHVGFTLANETHNWMELRAYEFLSILS